ncbi:MAG: hypothetical protein J6X63_05700 [Bacteroidales bacterium]|nr:hypothetical protein [Bacteroidales bacterium]
MKRFRKIIIVLSCVIATLVLNRLTIDFHIINPCYIDSVVNSHEWKYYDYGAGWISDIVDFKDNPDFVCKNRQMIWKGEKVGFVVCVYRLHGYRFWAYSYWADALVEYAQFD